MRLDKLLSHCGLGTRTEVKALIKSKCVTVNGKIKTSAKIHVEAENVLVNGGKVRLPPKELHLMLHKPLGVSCSHNPAESPLIYDLLPPEWKKAGLESAGRLDRLTSGLIILTTDGQLLHSLIHPKRKLVKRYRVVYEGELMLDAVKRVKDGLQLRDEEHPCLPAKLEIHEPDDRGNCATMFLHEGRYHQVRRMFSALGVQVVELHRDRIGNLRMPKNLLVGQSRMLTKDDINAMLELTL